MESKHEPGGPTPRGVLAVAGSAVVFLCFWAIGGVGFAKDSVIAAQYQYGDKKVTICHKTGSGKSVTITISRNALPAHLRHGDTIGPCPRRSEGKQKDGKGAKAEKARKAEKAGKAEKARKAEKTTSAAKGSKPKGSSKKKSAKGKRDAPAAPAASTENRAPEAKPDQPKGRGKGNGKEKEKDKGSAAPVAGQPAPSPAPAPSAGPPDDKGKGNGDEGGNGKGRGKK